MVWVIDREIPAIGSKKAMGDTVGGDSDDTKTSDFESPESQQSREKSLKRPEVKGN